MPLVHVAERFARRLGRELVLAHVEEDTEVRVVVAGAGFPAAPGGVLPPAPPWRTDVSSSTILDKVTSRVQEDHGVRTELLQGSPASALAALAGEEGAQAIVAGRRRIGAMRSAIEGSVSLDLIRDAGCPVMIVPRSGGGQDG